MILVETGIRALIGAVFGSQADGETDWARKLLHLLDAAMLLLTDRGFDAGDFLAAAAETKAQFLVRLQAVRRPPVLRHLPDGSFTSVIGGVKVRTITARVTVTCHDGTVYGDVHRLARSLGLRVPSAKGLRGLRPACTVPGGPGSAPARSSHRSAAGTSTLTENPAQPGR